MLDFHGVLELSETESVRMGRHWFTEGFVDPDIRLKLRSTCLVTWQEEGTENPKAVFDVRKDEV